MERLGAVKWLDDTSRARRLVAIDRPMLKMSSDIMLCETVANLGVPVQPAFEIVLSRDRVELGLRCHKGPVSLVGRRKALAVVQSR